MYVPSVYALLPFSLEPLQGILAVILIHGNYSRHFCSSVLRSRDRVDPSFFPWNTFCWIFPTSLTVHFSFLHPPLFCLPRSVPGLCLFWTPLPNWSSPATHGMSFSICMLVAPKFITTWSSIYLLVASPLTWK